MVVVVVVVMVMAGMPFKNHPQQQFTQMSREREGENLLFCCCCALVLVHLPLLLVLLAAETLPPFVNFHLSIFHSSPIFQLSFPLFFHTFEHCKVCSGVHLSSSPSHTFPESVCGGGGGGGGVMIEVS